LESFKAFLAYYQRAIELEITPEMTPGEMLQVVIDQGLPALQGNKTDDIKNIDISGEKGKVAMTLSPEQKARLFVQFFSKAMMDEEFKTVLGAAYAKDIKGITRLIEYGIRNQAFAGVDAEKVAYGLMAMIVGLSFFRVTRIGLADNEDNRVVCQDFLNHSLYTI
jgi:TetR/AcrR family transcriptional repressor of bet genes